jgi:hypothetical protein
MGQPGGSADLFFKVRGFSIGLRKSRRPREQVCATLPSFLFIDIPASFLRIAERKTGTPGGHRVHGTKLSNSIVANRNGKVGKAGKCVNVYFSAMESIGCTGAGKE